MEISVASPSRPTEDSPLIKPVDSLSSTVDRLVTKIAKQEATIGVNARATVGMCSATETAKMNARG